MKAKFKGISRCVLFLVTFAVVESASAFYDSGLGRWINRDPYEDAERFEGPNLYTFVNNEPVQTLDTDGRKALSCDEIGGLIGKNNQCSRVDDALLKCLFYRESTFDPDAVNKGSGATGLGQMTDVAAVDVGCGNANLKDPAVNIQCTSKYLCLLLKRTKGNLDETLKRFSNDKSGKYGNAVKDCADCLRKARASGNPCQQNCLNQAKKNPTR